MRHARVMIAYMQKNLFLLTLSFFAAALLFGALLLKVAPPQDCVSRPHLMHLRGDITITTLTTAKEHAKGLSGHLPLNPDEGMLFQFDAPAKRSFWMKDMLFPIDIIWLDRNLRVLSFFENVQPDSYPQSYESPEEMYYALEMSAGSVSSRGITAGDLATIGTHCGK